MRPGARAGTVGGGWGGPRGPALLVAVRARVVDGRAGAAVIDASVTAFGLRRTDVEIVAGHRRREKIVELTGEDEALGVRPGELLAS